MNKEEIENKLKDNEKLVDCILHKYFGYLSNTNDYEDFRQEGLIGLYKAIITYKPEMSKFSTYAYNVIYKEILNKLKKSQRNIEKKECDMISINETFNEDQKLTYENVISNGYVLDNTAINNIARNKLVNRVYNIIPKRHKSTFMYMLKGLNTKEIAKIKGCGTQNITKQKRNMKKIIDEMMEKEYVFA